MGAPKKEGYLDDLFHILDAHKHPCIILGHFSLKWMGCGIFAEEPLDLLIRDRQITEIISELVNIWEEVPLDTEAYLQPSPRIFKLSDDSFSIKLWTESATHLVVDAGPNDHVEVPDCNALNAVLMEESMHPGPATGIYRPYLFTTPHTRFLPHTACQSPMRHPSTKIYIPTVARYLSALLAQIHWLHENDHHFKDYGPRTDVGLLVRYLFLEIPSQRKRLLPQLDNKTSTQLEQILDGYKRTQKLKYELPDD